MGKLHRLNDIDPDSRVATCAIDGPVAVVRNGTSSAGTPRWLCLRRPPSERRWKHILSAVDTEARKAICAHCGPVRIYRHNHGRQIGGAAWVCARQHAQWSRQITNRKRLAATCERCGFVPEHVCQLDINHRDGDNRNDAPENLETLCANCHRFISWQQRQDRRFQRDGEAGWRWMPISESPGVKQGNAPFPDL